jgi:hypothetical protein
VNLQKQQQHEKQQMLQQQHHNMILEALQHLSLLKLDSLVELQRQLNHQFQKRLLDWQQVELLQQHPHQLLELEQILQQQQKLT